MPVMNDEDFGIMIKPTVLTKLEMFPLTFNFGAIYWKEGAESVFPV